MAALDSTAEPCQDFYQYACGGWIKAHPIPPDKPRRGQFDEVQERNQALLRGILERAATVDPARDPLDAQIGDYYASCMDENRIEHQGLTSLVPFLDRIENMSSRQDLPAVLADLHQAGVGALFFLGAEQNFQDATQMVASIHQGGLGLPERDYYFRTDEHSAALRRAYVAHIAAMLRLAGASTVDAARQAERVLALETELARGALDVVSLRDPKKRYHRLRYHDLLRATPAFAWPRYLTAVGAPAFTHLTVVTPRFLVAIEALAGAAPLADWQAYLRWQTLHAAAPLLPGAFVEENFGFYGRTLTGAQVLRPRWKRCVQLTDGALGEALGRRFVERYFPGDARARMETLVHAIESAFAAEVDALDWMGTTTKTAARQKLAAVANKIGHPQEWRDYGSVRIVRDDALGNQQRAEAFDFHRDVAKIGKPVDRAEWGMSPPTVNAYYSALLNDMNFPAGILQPPFFDRAADDAINYGAIGAIVGHELTHGFDDSGRKFDARGNLREWWTANDARAFEARVSCFVEQYGSYPAIGELKLNGKLTLGENVADNGGVVLAYRALAANGAGDTPAVSGLTSKQRFFLAWAQNWCEVETEKLTRLRVQTDTHALGRQRTNGVLANVSEFAAAFACKPGDAMVRANACRLW